MCPLSDPSNKSEADKQSCMCLGAERAVDAGKHTFGRSWYSSFLHETPFLFSWTHSLMKFPRLLYDTVTEFQQGNVNIVINFIPNHDSYTIPRHNRPGSFPSYHFDADNCQHPGSHMLKMGQAQDRKNPDPWINFQKEIHNKKHPLNTLGNNVFIIIIWEINFCLVSDTVMFIVYIATSWHQICIHSPLPHKSNTPEDRMYNIFKGVLRLSTSTFSFIKK